MNHPFFIFSNYFTTINIVEFFFVLIILWIGVNKVNVKLHVQQEIIFTRLYYRVAF